MAAQLFRDPIYDGATDPVLVRNPVERAWWLVYTARRATAPTPGVGWVHGSDLGFASSADDGRSWTYRGTLPGLEHELGRNTFWAPEFCWLGSTCHMFVSYIRGVPEQWAGHERHIHHYSADADLQVWTHHGQLDLASSYVIDACVFALPGGGFRMWYKNEADGSSTWSSDSPDLFTWSGHRRVLATAGGHEGPNVFAWAGRYWLIVDSWGGQLAFCSEDLESWRPAGRILSSDSGSAGTDDVGPGLHADVVVDGARAYVVYFTHPGDIAAYPDSWAGRRSTVHAAELDVADGELRCARAAPLVLTLGASAG